MSIFNFLFKKKSEEDHIGRMNNSLKSSFSNIKNDMLHLHKTISSHTDNTSKKFQEVENRVRRMELILMTLNNISNKEIKETKIVIPQQQEPMEEPEEQIELISVLNGIPKAELKLFKTLHDLQLSLNAKQVSYRSLASYLYPGKEYSSIRSTITQFVLRLHTEGLIEKQRIGKETYIRITNHGNKILKDVRVKRLIKEIEIKD